MSDEEMIEVPKKELIKAMRELKYHKSRLSWYSMNNPLMMALVLVTALTWLLVLLSSGVNSAKERQALRLYEYNPRCTQAYEVLKEITMVKGGE